MQGGSQDRDQSTGSNQNNNRGRARVSQQFLFSFPQMWPAWDFVDLSCQLRLQFRILMDGSTAGRQPSVVHCADF